MPGSPLDRFKRCGYVGARLRTQDEWALCLRMHSHGDTRHSSTDAAQRFAQGGACCLTENVVAKKPSYKPADRSQPADKDEQGRVIPAQPGSDEQSGSTGRPTDTHENGRATDTGQGRYGQTGAGNHGRETLGQERYRRSGPDGGAQPEPASNPGSGRPDVDPHDDQNSRDRDGKRRPRST